MTTRLLIFAAVLAGTLSVVAIAALLIQRINGDEAAQDFVIDGIMAAGITFLLATLAAAISAMVALARWLWRGRDRHA
ncbi:hypothetical protein JQ604_37045 [Bradyrhizobium jicamae]|uniref:hypothetical protein n=1 Tax=Bradyrhizobium jicamae TaxID=280332 RepID=UPI001BA98C8D|nr:hypothetical protein [Bradyrhizobium jicamae]MBR0757819.1 hypothetical protein [Bradyrhizobium jicamae]